MNHMTISRSDIGAFRVELEIVGAGAGPLAGLTFGVKDVFDIAGHTTGGGNPDFLASHLPAVRTAPAVEACLEAGARLVGITICDELAFSPFGENFFYGTPLNSAAPDRVPGGSSSGSASAAAAGLVDFALGTDTAGSVRIPASYCGLYGMRPTYGAVSTEGVMPLSPTFDTVGWLARERSVLERVGEVLLPSLHPPAIRRLLLLEETIDLLEPAARPAIESAIDVVSAAIAPVTPVRLTTDLLAGCLAQFNTLRPAEIWAAHGSWIERTRPRLGPQVTARLATVKAAAEGDTSDALAFRKMLREHAAGLLGEDGAFVFPTTPTIAPRKGFDDADAPGLRDRVFRVTSLAPMLGFPEVSVPMGHSEGSPIGLSLLGPAGADLALLRAIQALQSEK
jgi:amidase